MYSFKKESRLLSKRDFRILQQEGRRLVGKHFCVDVRPAKRLRLGITASGRYGPAHERNRFKRLIREAFRLHQACLPSADLHVVPRQRAKGARFTDIATELLALFDGK
ncbi:MAG: ribonuclease P protein component [Verrucomicrobiota bacterium]|nr:ribonuclease P protein component [Verrucomicrobiota bacterium]